MTQTIQILSVDQANEIVLYVEGYSRSQTEYFSETVSSNGRG